MEKLPAPGDRRGPRGAGRGLLLAAMVVLAASPVPACRRSRPVLARGDAAVVLLAPPMPVPAGVSTVDEREPTAPGESPMTLALAAGPGLAVMGTLAEGLPPDDEDLYILEVPGGPPVIDTLVPASDGGSPGDAGAPASRALAVEVTPSAGLATMLELRDQGGALLGSSAAAAGERHGLPNLAVRPGGRYQIAVRRNRPRKPAAAAPTAIRPTGAYALILRETALGAGDEREPNDSLDSATALGPAHASPEVAGYFGTSKDRDHYRVPVGEASEFTTLSVFLTPPSALAGTLTVFDRAGVKVQSARGRPGERVVLRSLAPAALSPPGGPQGEGPFFFVGVQAEGGADLQHRYVLGVRSEPSPGGEREPNDQPVRATPAQPGGINGFLGPGDVDIFRFEVVPGNELWLELTPPRRVDVVLEVLLPGAPRPQRSDAARRGQSESLRAVPTAAGAALIRVQGKRATDYDAEEPYTLTVELRPPGAPAAPAEPAPVP
jgi:hypothetical protein